MWLFLNSPMVLQKNTLFQISDPICIYHSQVFSQKKVQPLGYYFKHLRLNLFTGLLSISISHDLLVNITLVRSLTCSIECAVLLEHLPLFPFVWPSLDFFAGCYIMSTLD